MGDIVEYNKYKTDVVYKQIVSKQSNSTDDSSQLLQIAQSTDLNRVPKSDKSKFV